MVDSLSGQMFKSLNSRMVDSLSGQMVKSLGVPRLKGSSDLALVELVFLLQL